MKKSAIFVLILLILPIISAVEFNVNDNYAQGETLIAKISGTFVSSLTTENILFYRGHVRIPMQYEIAKLGEDYYVYALLTGKTQNNYSIAIENAKYMKGAEISEETLTRNFSITDKVADFSITPGFVSASENFSLEIQNLQDAQINVDISSITNSSGKILILPGELTETSISLKSGETKKIEFKLLGDSGLQTILLKTNDTSYNIPVYVTSTSSSEEQKEELSIEPSEINYSITTNSVTNKTIHIYNLGNSEIKNISLSLSDSLKSYANLSQNQIESLSANSNIPIEITFFSSTEKAIEGELIAKTNESLILSSISLNFISNYVAPANETQSSSSTKTCAELQGVICNTATETCSRESIYAKDNVCCLGTCNKIQKSSAGKIIAGIIIFVIVAGLLYFYFKKYRKAKKPVNLLEISRGKK